MEKVNIKKYVLHCALIMLTGFFLLMVNVFYYQVIAADELAENPLNHRSSISNIVRGSILDSEGRELAVSYEAGSRQYPYGAIAAPVTGYVGETIGSAGVEQSAGSDLSGQSRQLASLGPIAQFFQQERGNDVRVTIDADAQKTAYYALDGRKGAVVVLDADTGAVIAMVSRPSFNPESIEDAWDELVQREDSPLLNRATQGLYPPGSIIKPLIADAALDEKVTDVNEAFQCDGLLQFADGTSIRESHGAVHGSVRLEDAIIHSCNVTFGTVALRLKPAGLESLFSRFGFNKELDGDITDASAHLPGFSTLSEGDIAQVGIGQSSLLVTPLRMAMTAMAFGNGGVMMKPYLVDEVIAPSGLVISKFKPVKWLEVTSAQRAAIIDSYMEKVVTDGTGAAAYVPGIRVTGKTGTAENSAGADHGWFMGTAQLKNRKIAFGIIVENSGGGGSVAAPIARQIIAVLMNK